MSYDIWCWLDYTLIFHYMHKILFYISPWGVSLLIRRCWGKPRPSNTFLNDVSCTCVYHHLCTCTNKTCGTRWHTGTCVHVFCYHSALRVSLSSVHMLLASINTCECSRVHTALSNSESIKHSVRFLPERGGREATHRLRAAPSCHNWWPPLRQSCSSCM